MRLRTVLSAGLLCLGLGYVAYTQNQPAPPITIEKVKEDLYVIYGGNAGNVAVYVTNEGVILVDDKFEQHHDEILGRIKAVTDQPVKYILSTHYHADHSGGNAKFLPTATIISTVNTRKNIVEKKQSNAPPNMQAAQVTFENEAHVNLGGKEVIARYLGRGHTNGDAIIYFPALKMIHTGDLMSGNPLIDYNGGGSFVEWTKTLDTAMKTFDFDTVIPGHGNVTDKAGLTAWNKKVGDMREQFRKLVKAKKSKEEIAKFAETTFQWAPNSLQQQWSVPGLMTELK